MAVAWASVCMLRCVHKSSGSAKILLCFSIVVLQSCMNQFLDDFKAACGCEVVLFSQDKWMTSLGEHKCLKGHVV